MFDWWPQIGHPLFERWVFDWSKVLFGSPHDVEEGTAHQWERRILDYFLFVSKSPNGIGIPNSATWYGNKRQNHILLGIMIPLFEARTGDGIGWGQFRPRSSKVGSGW